MRPLSRHPHRRRLDADTKVMEALSGYMPNVWRYSYDLMRQTGMHSGRLYPALRRLEEAGVVESEWREPVNLPGDSEPRPRRRGYRLASEWRRSLT